MKIRTEEEVLHKVSTSHQPVLATLLFATPSLLVEPCLLCHGPDPKP